MNVHHALACLLLLALIAADAPNPLARIKGLEGTWKGKEDNGKDVTLVSQPVSNGTAVMETLKMHGDMITMYNADGGNVMLTHYCSLGNQPRMKGEWVDDKTLKFNFVDATNLPKPTDAHMHGLVLRFKDADHLTQEWTFYENGKETRTVKMDFERQK